MESTNSSLEQLKAFLNKLFQFESQDLDFGVYKILHYKQEEIKQFINELLVDTVKEQLQTLTHAQVTEASEMLDDLMHDDIVKGWVAADDAEKKTLEKFGRDKIKKYRELKSLVESVQMAIDAENQIYNHLTIFFSRYYDKGDFVSKRRFGKNEKYMVPYNGEETHFYWANHDQYYIKSSETFQKFSFRAGPYKSDLTVHFKLTDAQTEQGNVKADAGKYFMLSEKNPELNSDEINIFFEYRPLSDDEKKTIGTKNVQKKVNEQAAKKLESQLKKHAPAAGLWDMEDEQTLLFRKLQHYTQKNQYDFFIHKNLKGFLERELDFYIKSELVSVDDLYVSETDFHLERIRHNFKTIKVFKKIADTIITFLSQIEEFQKKLWEKKKFVLSTQWVITLDRLVEYAGLDAATPFLAEVIQNKDQIAEWQALFGKKIIPAGKMTVKSFKSDLFGWMRLPIDTVHFSQSFKENLLNVLSQKIDLEKEADGLALHSDNFHGLVLLYEKFYNNIDAMYIDPPYNTDASEIIYKNGYKSSSWITLINDRLIESKKLLKTNGILCATIDDFQKRELYSILIENFSKEGFLGTVVVRNNPSGRPVPTGFGVSHEYGLFFSNSKNAMVGRFERTEKQNRRYNLKDKKGSFMWELLRKRGSDSERDDSPKAFFPIYFRKNKIRVPEMEWDETSRNWINIGPPEKDEIALWPVDENGVERRWRWGLTRVKNDINELKVEFNGSTNGTVYYKYRPPQGSIPPTNWIDAKYSSTEHGTGALKKLFNEYNPFSYPKSIYAVKDSLSISIENSATICFVLDYFAGSGTTFHAVQLLNQEDGGKRKCILVEQGDYVYSIIIPRIKKIAYTFDWKNGKPKDDKMNGAGVFFKYQRLEQYEESLENISFTVSKDTAQKAFAFKEYIPKYFLEFETRDSQSLVNTEAMNDPWHYELKIWDGLTYDTRQAVDLVETFNYLIGLHMQKYITRQINGQKYQFVYGATNGGKQVLVVWRSTESWEVRDYEADRDAVTKVITAFPHDLLYINGQALIDGYEPIEHIFKNKMVS